MARIELERFCVGLLAVSLVVAPGCYSGLSLNPASASDGGSGDTDGHEGPSDPESGDEGGDGGDETGGDVDPPSCDGVQAGSLPLRRLTRSAYQNTIRDLLGLEVDVEGFPGDQHVVGFVNNVSVPVTLVAVEDYQGAAESLAGRATQSVGELTACDPDSAPLDCAESFVRDFGRRAWRRALTDGEVAEVLALYDAGSTHRDGIRLVVQGILQSPFFLYLVELGTPTAEPGVTELTSFEMAARLSYLLWNSTPDDELLDVAEADLLRDPEELRRQAERMLMDDRATESLARFHRQWVTMEDHALESTIKDDALYPEFESLRPSMAREIELLAEHVVRAGDGRFETLMTAPFSFVDAALAEFYGLDVEADAADLPGNAELPPDVRAVQLRPEQGVGLLTRAGVLAALANPTATNIPARGRFIIEKLQCQQIPDPPPDVEGDPPVPQPGQTAREQLDTKTSIAPCSGCHDLLNPAGGLFEHYGPSGEFRQTDLQGNAVDASGALVSGDIEGDYDSIGDLVHLFPESAEVRDCYARQWFRFSYGADVVTDQDACNQQGLAERFENTDGNIRELLLALVVSDGFRHRITD